MFFKQENGEITDFISYFHLQTTILNHPQYKTLNICYLYYYATTHTALADLVNDCLVEAYKVNEKEPYDLTFFYFQE